MPTFSPTARRRPHRLRPAQAALSALAAALLTVASTPAATAAPQTEDHGRPSTGCGRAPGIAPGRTVPGEIEVGGLRRSYLIHLPPDYHAWRPQSLTLSFHGQGRTSAYQEELSGVSAYRTIAVYPQGVVGGEEKTAWQGAPYSAPVDDVLFTGKLLDRLQRDLCVDTRRIYATGKSNGGGFTGLLACRMGDRIAAFAPVSGAFYPQAGVCHPDRPVPILDFHGGADRTIPYAGDPVKGLPPLPDWLSAWAERDGCAPRPRVHTPLDGVEFQRWHGCRARGALEHYRLDDLAHDWPSTSPNPDSDEPAALDATPIIMRFFAAHSR
ncbi:alpha/beta hydrolase family esterase [Amycolatopsis nigrescens]|uniref:alpha/beta hydrolase family esterase n=1 Tax=Amycolatopsis nigrescens TaxID=381445 RepID=UPI000363A7BA|nr:hypothetical protein [Amycolatopsis nigrescens]